MRPALRATLSDFSEIEEYVESGAFNEHVALDSHDFRGHPYELNEAEAEPAERRMQQLSAPRVPDRAIAELEPFTISPLPEIAAEKDSIEGLGYRDPLPKADHFAMLTISLEDEAAPLPSQFGKFMGDTLDSLFRACSLGSFTVGGGSSREGEDGRYIEFDVVFYVGINGEPAPALRWIREAMSWVGAPEGRWTGVDTDVSEWSLGAHDWQGASPAVAAQFVQLATPTVARWKNGHRIDRVPFTSGQRRTIRKILREFSQTEVGKGWVQIAMDDGGGVSIYTKYLDEADGFDTLNIIMETPTLDVTRLVYRLANEGEFMLFPMAVATTQAIAQQMDSEWPTVKVIDTPELLHAHLTARPF